MQAAPRPEQSFKDLFDTLAAQLERVLRGQAPRDAPLARVPVLRGPPADRGRARRRQDVARQGDRALDRRRRGAACSSPPTCLPSDVTGVSVWDRGRSDFEFRPGGVFANVVLADEINRASPKTQSALLEAMEERQVTVDAQTYPLPRPFLVIATQNPVELEGTYPLPEAQLDRFLLRLRIGYPDRDAELAILDAQGVDAVDRRRARTRHRRRDGRGLDPRARPRSTSSPELQGYIVDLVEATRHHRDLMLGVSPRGALALQTRVARARRERRALLRRARRRQGARGRRCSSTGCLLSSEAMMRGVNPADVLAVDPRHGAVPARRPTAQC